MLARLPVQAEQAERRRLEALDQQMAREMADRLKEVRPGFAFGGLLL